MISASARRPISTCCWRSADRWASSESSSDGTAVTIRAIRRDGSGRLLEAFTNLDRESIYTRFFSYKRELTETELKQLTDIDFDHVVALVATTTTEDVETIIAGGRYITDDAPGPTRSAEVAFDRGGPRPGNRTPPLAASRSHRP
jgi:hypothetical protein